MYNYSAASLPVFGSINLKFIADLSNAVQKIFNKKSKRKAAAKSGGKNSQTKTDNSIKAVYTKEAIMWYKNGYDEYDTPVSSLSFKESITNLGLKSIVYYDEEIAGAYIDYDCSKDGKIKCMELRRDNRITGIYEQAGRYIPYCINDGEKKSDYTRGEVVNIYCTMKNILKKARENKMLLENNPVSEINSEIDSICMGIIHRK